MQQIIYDAMVNIARQRNVLLQKHRKRVDFVHNVRMVGLCIIACSIFIWTFNWGAVSLLLGLVGILVFLVGMSLPLVDPDNWSDQENIALWTQQIDALWNLQQRHEAGKLNRKQTQSQLNAILKLEKQ